MPVIPKWPSKPPPDPEPNGATSLRLPQVRVLRVLYEAKGPLTRQRISNKIGNKTPVVVTRAIGYSDPEARERFEKTKDGGGTPERPCLSLLSLGFVAEHVLDIDGIEEVAYSITAAGRAAYETPNENGVSPKDLDLPPLRD